MAFDVAKAREAGYGDDDILSHLTATRKFDIQGARAAGYSNDDIISHLSGQKAAAAPVAEKPLPGNKYATQSDADAIRANLRAQGIGAPKPETSFLPDIAGSLVSGAGQIVKLPAQIYGLATGDFDTAPMRAGKAVEEYGQGIMSPGLRAKKAEVEAAIKEAESRGFGAEVMTTLKGYLSDPYLLANFAVEQIPSLIGTLGGGKVAQTGVNVGAKIAQRAAPAAETLAKAGTVGAIGTGATMQGASVGQQTYDEIAGLDPKVMTESPEFNELVQQGMTPEKATKKLATDGARIAAGLAAGVSAVTAGIGGVEKAAFSTTGVKGGIARRIATGGIKEGAQEAVEEGLGQGAQNLAVSGVDPNKSLTQGVGSQATLGALGGAPAGGVVSALAGRAATPVPMLDTGTTESVAAPVDTPAGLPDIDTPIGFETEGGVQPVRVMEYIEQDGETYARVRPETAPEAALEPAFMVPVADLQAALRDRAPDPGGAARRVDSSVSQAEAEDITAQAEEARQTAREKRRGPELGVDVRQAGPRLESVPDADLERRAASMQQVVERLTDDPSVAISNLMDTSGMDAEQAHAAVQQDIARYRTRIADMRTELDRRGTVTGAAPDVDPRVGLTPLLRARPDASEAETGSLTRPRDPAPQGTLAPVEGSEAETGQSLTRPRKEAPLMTTRGGTPVSAELAALRPKPVVRAPVVKPEPAQRALPALGKPSTLMGLIRAMGVDPNDKQASDLIEALGHKVVTSKTGTRMAPSLGVGRRAVLRKGGASIDAIREAAEEAGMIGRGRSDESGTTDIGDLMDAAANARNVVSKQDMDAAIEQRERDRMTAMRDKYGDEPVADAVADEDVAAVADDLAARNAVDSESLIDPDDSSTYMDYEAPHISDAEWASLMQEAEDARASADTDSRDAGEGTDAAPSRVEESAEDAGRGVEPEPDSGKAEARAEDAAAAEDNRAPKSARTAFEPAPKSVKGGGEQGVLGGTERSAKQAQAARDSKGGLRSDAAQEKPGGMFDERADDASLFEYGSPRAEAASVEAVKDALRDILGPDARVRIVDMITDQDGSFVPDATGRYDPITNIIYIAAHSPDMVGTARHEALHLLRDLGVITDTQWDTLSAESARWRKKFNIDANYNPDNVLDGDGNKVSPEMLEQVRQEEAVAAAYAEWLRGDKTYTGRIKAAFERIRAFMDALRTRLFASPETARAIFRDMDAGKMAPFASRALAARFAAAATDVNMAAGTVAADGAHAAGNSAAAKEGGALQLYNRLPADKKTGPRWLSMPTRIMSFPLARAATDRLFAAFTTPMLQSQKRASAITRAAQDGLEPIFRLPDKEQTTVKQALELIALNNAFPPAVNGRMTLRNESSKVARLTAPNRIVRLSPEATKALQSYKAAMDGAWDSYAQAAVKAVTGYDGPMSVKEARAVSEAARARNDRQAANDAATAADILEAAESRKRTGYYPGMRSGDTQIIVRRKLTPEFARIIGQAKARGYPKGEALTAERLNDFLNAATKPADVKFWSELRSDFDTERGKASAAQGPLNDDMVWNEHFFLKPPLAGVAIPTTQGMRNRRIAEKSAEIKTLMEKRGVDMNEHEIVVRPVKEDMAASINDQSIPVLEKLLMMTMNGNPQDFARVWEGMNKNIRKNMVSSFRRASNVVPGFSMDIGDTLSRYSHAVGAVASKLEYRKQIDEALDAIQNNSDPNYDPAMKGKDGYAARLKDYVNNPANDFNALKSFGFMYYMAGVPSTAVQNMTQIPMVALPQLTGIIGPRGASILGNAWQQSLRAVRIGKDGVRMNVENLGRTDGERKFLSRMEDEGQITASVTRDLMGRDYDAGPELKAAQGFWKKTYSIAASMFDTAESLNRATALLAGYRAAQTADGQAKIKRAYGKNENFKAIANRDGSIDPEAFAEFFSREVNFEGSRVNRPEALRGIGGVLLQFKSYPMNYISLLRKNATQMGPEGKMAAAMMTAMMLAAGGLAGLPFAEDFADAYDNIVKAITGDDPQTIATIQEAMSDWGLGKLGAEAMLRGFSRSTTGLDLSRSLGMGNVAPRLSDPLQMLGPTPAALLAGPYYGYQRFQSGQGPAAAAMEVAPRALKGPIQAAAVLPDEGLATRRGRTVIPPSEISAGDRAARTLGFQPASFSREYEARGRRQELLQAAQAKSGSMRAEYARLLALGEDMQKAGRAGAAEDARAKARKVAEKMVEAGIKPPVGADLQKLIRSQLDPETADIKKAPKRLREEMGRNPFPERRERRE